MRDRAIIRKVGTVLSVLCVVTALGSIGVAPAAAGDPPHTDTIDGTFTFTTVQLKQRVCAGGDGTYADIAVRQAGTAAGDPRLSGELELTSRVLLNTTTGDGTSEGRFTVRDAGKKKAFGDFLGVITPAPPMFRLHGVLVGRVLDEGTGATEEELGGGRVVANFEATFDANLNGTGAYGAVGTDALRPAVIQDGHCGK